MLLWNSNALHNMFTCVIGCIIFTYYCWCSPSEARVDWLEADRVHVHEDIPDELPDGVEAAVATVAGLPSRATQRYARAGARYEHALRVLGQCVGADCAGARRSVRLRSQVV